MMRPFKESLDSLIDIKELNLELSDEEEEQVAKHLYGEEHAAIFMECFYHQKNRYDFNQEMKRKNSGKERINSYIKWAKIQHGTTFSDLVELVLTTNEPITRAQAITYLSTVEPVGHNPSAIIFSPYGADKYLIDQKEEEFNIRDRLDPNSFEYLEKKYQANMLNDKEIQRYMELKYGERVGILHKNRFRLSQEEKNELFILKYGERALELKLIDIADRSEEEEEEYRYLVYGEEGLEVYKKQMMDLNKRFRFYEKTRLTIDENLLFTSKKLSKIIKEIYYPGPWYE